MAYNSLHDFISALEAKNELIRITSFVDPVLEITEITDRFSKQPGGGKALLFENTGTGFPVLTNALGSRKRICLALGANNLDSFGEEINFLLKQVTSEKRTFTDKLKLLATLGKLNSLMPKSVSGRGKCQEVIIHNPDLSILPILKCWPADGGRFITLPLVHTIDPVSGARNVGMYRMQVFDKNLTGMHWHRHKTGARHYEEYKKLDRKMPIAVALGGDPAYTYAATAPLPDQVDEYILAGFIRKKRVELVKCITQDIEVPCDTDIVIEGYVDPQEALIWEGPFGDHTGFYSLEDWYPKFHVTCITHRHNAVYPATIVGIPPQEDAWIAKATERFFLTPMKFSLAPEITDMNLPPEGVAHNLALLSIEKRYPGQGLKVINSLWGAGQMMFNKVMVVTDNKTNIHNYKAFFRHVTQTVRLPDDLIFSKGPLDVLDHSSDKFAFGGKIGIDATQKLPEEEEVPFIEYQPMKLDSSMLLQDYPDISSVSVTLQNEGIPALLISVKDNSYEKVIKLGKSLATMKLLENIKLIVFYDEKINLDDHELCCWLALSNIDPVRDCSIVNRKSPLPNCLCVDATTKTLKSHHFTRPWPNIVTSSPDTIKTIDNHWERYFNDILILSPSLKYQQLCRGYGAVGVENKA
jgi:4-hydroxy-3-polyprenylbenzoate decarboxylase